MDILKVDEVARILRVAPITVRRQIAAGKLPAVRIGRAVRIDRAALPVATAPARDRDGLADQDTHGNGFTARAQAPNSSDGKEDIWANYDPERVREALEGLRGILSGVDTEKLKREIRAARGQKTRKFWR